MEHDSVTTQFLQDILSKCDSCIHTAEGMSDISSLLNTFNSFA